MLFAQKREQRCRLRCFAALHVVCAVSPADSSILFADIIRLLLMVPIYSWISLASYLFWVRFLVSGSGPFCRALTPVMKFPRITLHPYFSSVTHTRPSSSPHSSIFCSRICPRIPKCRKLSFANVVCQRKPTRNADGVGSPEGSGSSLSGLSGGNRRCGSFLLHFLIPIPSSMNYHQDGLFFLQLMKWCVLQYCVIRPMCVISHTIRLPYR